MEKGVDVGFSLFDVSACTTDIISHNGWYEDDDDLFSGCFPADAVVYRPDGSAQNMSDLKLNDFVMTVDSAGKVAPAQVYLFGHKDPLATIMHVTILTETGDSLSLSSGHFMPISTAESIDDADWQQQTIVRARDVDKGMVVWVLSEDGESLKPARVQTVYRKYKQGLFNPFTRNGFVLVNGVAASEYSEWFLEDVVPDRYIPSIYHAIQSPVARVIGPLFPEFTEALDKSLEKSHTEFTFSELFRSLTLPYSFSHSS